MIHNLYSVLDKKASAYLPVFLARTDQEAMRMMKMTLLRGPSPFSDFPEDYHLYTLGEFDDEHGTLASTSKPLPIASISELLESVQRDHGRPVPTQNAMDLQVPAFKHNAISDSVNGIDHDEAAIADREGRN